MEAKKETLITSGKSKKGNIFVIQSKNNKNYGTATNVENEIDNLKQKERINKFPIDIFPNKIQEIILEANEKYQFSIDYLGAGILSAASTAIGNTHKTKVKENWIQQANLFMVIVGRPGDAKSHALNFCYKPINEHEDFLYNQYLQALKEYEEIYNSEKNSQIKKPLLKKIIISDFTPEALILNHFNNPRGICIYVDELSGWLKNFNRYNNSGESQMYLSLWTGNAFSIDRASGKSIRITNPYISVIGSTQTSVLNEFAKNGRSTNGFMDRLLFVYPDNPKTLKWNLEQVNTNIILQYSEIINKLIKLEANRENEPVMVPFDKQAKKFLFDWQNNRPENHFFEYERSIDVKLQEYVIRFSLILSMLYFAVDGKDKLIDLKSVKGAIKLFDYFYQTAMKVKKETIGVNYLETLTELQRNILNELPKEFTTSQGVKIACRRINGKSRISERQFKTYLNDRKLFKRVSRGNYIKII